MPEKLLPIYEIQDFKETSGTRPDFYFNTMEAHLREHAFIQKPHKHNFYLLIFITSGTGTHTIDFLQYPVQARTIFFLSPGQVHAWSLSADTTGFVLFFNAEFYLLSHSQKSLFSFPFFNSLLNKPVLQLEAGAEIEISAILNQIEKEFRQTLWKKEDMIRDLLNILLINLTRSYQMQFSGAAIPAGNSSFLRQFEFLVDQHFREHLAVNFYADKLHLTPKQLSELCKKAVGKTSSELIQDRLLLEAKRLLLHSDQTITQIAAELGYFDNSYFSRFFKKHTGQTPEQFRQTN